MRTPTSDPTALSARLALIEGYSLEITAKDVEALRAAAPRIPPRTPVSVTFLPGEDMDGRLAAVRAIREMGFLPSPHFSARRLASQAELQTFLTRLVDEAGVRRCFIVAGDPKVPAGPFEDSLSLIDTGLFERSGVRTLAIGGHPEGHPVMSTAETWRVLQDKCAAIILRGMSPLIVTQFGFDAEAFLTWLVELRRRGITCPVRLGIPGPAGINTLLKFAARCGVGASSMVMSKYGLSLTKLMGTAGPDTMVAALAQGLGPQHGQVHLHFYPFGGLEKTVEWITDYEARTRGALPANERA